MLKGRLHDTTYTTFLNDKEETNFTIRLDASAHRLKICLIEDEVS